MFGCCLPLPQESTQFGMTKNSSFFDRAVAYFNFGDKAGSSTILAVSLRTMLNSLGAGFAPSKGLSLHADAWAGLVRTLLRRSDFSPRALLIRAGAQDVTTNLLSMTQTYTRACWKHPQ